MQTDQAAGTSPCMDPMLNREPLRRFGEPYCAAVPDFPPLPVTRPPHPIVELDGGVGCNGAKGLTKDLADAGPHPNFWLKNSGTQSMPACDGKFQPNVTVFAPPGHSSEPAEAPSLAQTAGGAFGWVARSARRLAAQVPLSLIHLMALQRRSMLTIILKRAEFNMERRLISGFHALRWVTPAEPTACDRSIRRLADRPLF